MTDPDAGLAADILLDAGVIWLFFGTGVALGLCGALAYTLLTPALAPIARAVIVGSCLGATVLVCLLAWHNRKGAAIGRGVLLASVMGMAAVAAVAIGAGKGVHTVALGLSGVLLILVATLVSQRAALWLAGVCTLLVLAMAGAETAGLLPGAAAAAAQPMALALIGQLLVLAAAVAAGVLLARTIRHSFAVARAREQRFRGLLEVAADWYWEMDSAFRFTHVAEYVSGRSGVAPSQRLGKTPWEIEDFGIDAETLDAHRADLESHQRFDGLLLRRLGADGQWHWFSVSGEPRFDASGRFFGYWGVGRDVTHEMRARQLTAATEARYRELFARTPSPLVLHRAGRVIDANPAALTLFGFASVDDFAGRKLLSFYDEADGSRARAADRAAQLKSFEVGQSVPTQRYRLRSNDGRDVAVTTSSVIVVADGGTAILSIYHDETERLRSEHARRRADQLLAHVVATSPDLITIAEHASGRFVMVNDTYVAASGFSREEAIGKTSLELGASRSAAEYAAFVAELDAKGMVRDRIMKFVNRTGDEYQLVVSAARFRMDGQDYRVVTSRDVTRQENERLEREAILENASIGIAMTRNRVFQLANPRFEQMFGWAPGALVGQPGRAIWCSDEDYARIGREHGPALARREPIEVEQTMLRRDGSTFPCRLLGRAVDPSHPAKGGTIWIAEDVTERLAVEHALEQARDAAEAASRAKSAFLANTSHEIRTPLNGLVGLARMARQPGLDETRRANYLRQIDESAQALSGVISDILDLSKIEAGKLQIENVDFDLHALLESIEHGYAALAEVRGLTLQMRLAPAVPRRVLGDPGRLRQVLSNFLSNALKFTTKGGVEIEVHPATAPDVLCFEVRDSGPGIDATTQARLFTPFTQADESTTRRFGGTGLGLSICRQLAHLMGGEVGVTSLPGQGSCFWVELTLPSGRTDGSASIHGTLDGGLDALAGLQVLMVEDNPVNMMIAVALLEQWGVDVTQAGDGAQAVRAVAARADSGRPFDLVLMDVQMPVQGGYEATRELRRRFDAASLPIVALTAAALTSERDEALASGMNDFLTKPIDAQRLRDTLRRWGHPKSVA